MGFDSFVTWVFYGVLGFSSIYAVGILGALKKSIDQLNEKVAIIIEKTQWHEKWLEKHDDEIEVLRAKKP